MSCKNDLLFDGSEEKKLSEIDQLVVYATHVQVHQRHMAISFIVNNLLVLCKHDIKKLFVVIDTLQKDQAVSVRALLAEKLFEIGSYFSGHSKLGRYITSDLYDIIYKSLTDCSSQVRRAGYDSVFNLLNVNSIPHSLVEKTLLTVVFESTSSENDDELRADGVSFLLGLAPYMDQSTLMSTVLPHFLQLASDPSFHVRRACASHYYDMCKLVCGEASEMMMLEKFSNLCEDNVWGVRKACISSFPGVARSLGPAMRSTQLTELYLKLLGDQSRWVRLMAYQVLGEFISTFRSDEPKDMNVPDANQIESCTDVAELNLDTILDGKESRSEEMIESSTLSNNSSESNNQKVYTKVELSQTGKINMSYRSDSDGDDQPADQSSDSNNNTSARINYLTNEFNMKGVEDEITRSNVRCGEANGKNIVVSNFTEFVEKMFGDVNCDDDGVPLSSEILNDKGETFSRKFCEDDVIILNNANCKTLILDNSLETTLIDATSGDSNFRQSDIEDHDTMNYESINHQSKNLECSDKSQENCEFKWIAKCDDDVTPKEVVCSGGKKFLLRSPPVLLMLDAASLEESDAPMFETALNFGTTHHHVRSKPTNVCFGEEGNFDEDGDGQKCFDEEHLLLIDGSDKLETTDDFSKTSLSLPEEAAVASRPLSPVTCRTLKAGGGRWCRQTMVYVSSREGYGRMPTINSGLGRIKKSCEFKQCPIPGKLLDNFLEMSDSYLSELFDSEIQLHCAYCFPAVTLTLGKLNWPVLKEFYMTLVLSSQVKVRRTLSYSIHEMAIILGEDIVRADLLGVFDDFCCDVDEVKMGVVEHFYDFVKLLSVEDKLRYIDKLPGMTIEENGRNWRMRDLAIKELEKILALLTLSEMYDHLIPLVFTLMSDQVAIVRQSSIQLISKIIFLLTKENDSNNCAGKSGEGTTELKTKTQDQPVNMEELSSTREPTCPTNCFHAEDPQLMIKILHRILDELIQRFANSSNFRQRQSFILVCHHLLNIPSFPALANIFSPNFLLNPLLLLHSDAIINVRITLCRVLYSDFPKIASMDYIRKNPTDLLDPINKLWNDSDPDVHRLAEKFLSLVVH